MENVHIWEFYFATQREDEWAVLVGLFDLARATRGLHLPPVCCVFEKKKKRKKKVG